MARRPAVTRSLREHATAWAVALAAVLSVAYLIWQPQTLDLAAQTYRAELWEREGWVLWSHEWYGGFSVPGYSLLYPPLGALLGPALLGALCSLASAWLAASIATRAFGERAWLGVLWLGPAATVAMFGGRVTFALGLALGLGALHCVQRRRRAGAAVLALATALASPLAGLFTALAAGAVIAAATVPGRSQRRELPLAAAGWAAGPALAATLALVALFPSGGEQPFALSAALPIPLAAAALVLAARQRSPVLWWGAILYLALGFAALVVASPLGGNAARLGATFAGPLLALLLLPRRPVLLALAALPLLWWQWTATVRDLAAATGDPATEAAFYEPLLGELERRGEPPLRLHIPPTRNRWEAAYVAPRFPLARGWLRQLEAEDIPLFDSARIEYPGAYREWLLEQGVSWVALPRAERDYLAEREAELLEGDLPYLDEVWSSEDWRLFRFDRGGEQPLTEGDTELLGLGFDGFTVRTDKGVAELALRDDPWFEVTAGDACLRPGVSTPGLAVEVPRVRRRGEPPEPVTIEVRARFTPGHALGDDDACPERPELDGDSGFDFELDP
jgi:hypothetical protein